jgi:hypothetical protein
MRVELKALYIQVNNFQKVPFVYLFFKELGWKFYMTVIHTIAYKKYRAKVLKGRYCISANSFHS